MSSFLKRDRLAAMVGLALLAAPATTAHAQQMMIGQGMTNQQFAPQVGAGRIMSVPAAGFGGAPAGGYIPPYNPYYPGQYDPWSGGALTGAANLVGAQGQLMESQQKAFLGREAVRSAKTDNRRKTFDEYMYEKENTPTAEQERQKAMKEYLSRARNNPPNTEIWSGTALNTILQELRKRRGAG